MSSEKEKPAEEEGGGESAPLWIISFADMISLLMAFFVMLSTFNNYDKQEKEKLEATFHATVMACGGWLTMPPNNRLSPEMSQGEDVDKGPEVKPAEETQKIGNIDQTYSKKFFTDKTFLVPMELLFYSTTAALTTDGRQWLDNLSVYLTKVPGRIVIAEQINIQADTQTPLRSIAVAEYLTGKNVESGRISISTQGTFADSSAQQKQSLEISLLEKNICP